MGLNGKDIIEFRLTGYSYGADEIPTATVEIYINNENFRNKVNAAEHIFAEAEGNPQMPGHAPITPEELYAALYTQYKMLDSVSIFGCGCGVVECWPFDVSVDVGEKTVTWHSFKSYHRKSWDFSMLGKFVFDKQQYFYEVEKLLDFEKQAQEIYKSFQVVFEVQEHGRIKMHMSFGEERYVTSFSHIGSPFDCLLNMLKMLESGSSFEQVKIGAEGIYTIIKVCSVEKNDILSITVTQENDDGTHGNNYYCKSSRKNFIQAFKWAFQILEDDGFDPNFWSEHESGQTHNVEELHSSGALESFWDDPWFQFLREP